MYVLLARLFMNESGEYWKHRFFHNICLSENGETNEDGEIDEKHLSEKGVETVEFVETVENEEHPITILRVGFFQ